MKVVTSVNCFYDETFKSPVETQIQQLYDAGFRQLDMNFWDWCHDPASPFRKDDWRDWVGRIADTGARLGVTFVQSHAHVYNFLNDPDAAAKQPILERCLEASAMLGIPWVVFHPARLPDMDAQTAIDVNVKYFAPMAEMARKLGTGIALENMSRDVYGFTRAEDLCTLIDALDSPAVGACWDTGHAHIAGVDQPQSIRTLGARLKALHVQDNDGVSDGHTAPFFGTIDWQALVGALREIGYPGPFTYEAHNIVRHVPLSCRATAARLLYEIGVALVGDGE